MEQTPWMLRRNADVQIRKLETAVATAREIESTVRHLQQRHDDEIRLACTVFKLRFIQGWSFQRISDHLRVVAGGKYFRTKNHLCLLMKGRWASIPITTGEGSK